MTNLDHDAIRKAYPNVVTIQGDGIVLDADDKDITSTIEQSKIDTARATLDAEAAANVYQEDRRRAYPSIRDQLDYIYHNGIEKWKTDIVDPVKKKYPKP